MPTFNQLKDKSGYYIYAWTPKTGNITYKLKSEANPIIDDYDLRHGDDISWDVIKSLKFLRFIYTDGSGILEVGDFEPNPNQVQETSLTKSQAKALLKIIQDYYDLSESQMETLCSILDIEVPGLNPTRIKKLLRNRITSLSSTFPVSNTLRRKSIDDVTASATTWELGDKELGLRFLFASFSGADATDPVEYLSHDVFVSEYLGITKWVTGLTNRSRDAEVEIAQQMEQLVPIVVWALKDVGVNPGQLEELSGPDIRDFEDMPF
ncbi:hypothetical protein [Halococcus salsus]|uniref:hypothetical protein n=1 Tax=Halococcus salsus TaxID=2162894 RepID=UPI001356D55A|nr:hypothetical protein [Halococcus salsus]